MSVWHLRGRWPSNSLFLGKLKLAIPLKRFFSEQIAVNDFNILPIDFRHIFKIEYLPFHHRDPFDRLLIAQAITKKLPEFLQIQF